MKNPRRIADGIQETRTRMEGRMATKKTGSKTRGTPTRGARGAARAAAAVTPRAAEQPTLHVQRGWRVLTFNWNETYTCLLARVFPGLHVIDRPSLDQSENAWDMRVCEIPSGVRVVHDPEQARRNVADGMYDVIICHTVRDLEFVKPLNVAAILMAHTALEAELHGEEDRAPGVRAFLQQLLSARGILFASPSPAKMGSWGIPGDVIPHAIDVADYGGWIGDEERALVVGNELRKWSHATGYEALKEGLAGLPWDLLGNNPPDDDAAGMTLLGLESPRHTREQYLHHRAFVSANQAPYEDAVGLSMLEAMAYGMPVVMMAHPDSPVVHNKNGLVAKRPADLGRLTRKLLADRALARKLGAAARETVAATLPLDGFATSWRRLVDRAVRHWEVHRVRVLENTRIAQEHLALGLVHQRAGRLREAEEAFLAASQAAPDSAGPYCNLGAYYLNQGRLEEARKYLELSLYTDPYFHPALLNMARVNLLENVPEAAIPLLQAAISVDGRDLVGPALLAMAYLANGEAPRARELLDGLQTVGAPDLMVLPLMAQALRETQDVPRATEAARRWIELDPQNPNAYRELSQDLLLDGRFEEAHEALQRSWDLDPGT